MSRTLLHITKFRLRHGELRTLARRFLNRHPGLPIVVLEFLVITMRQEVSVVVAHLVVVVLLVKYPLVD